MYAAQQLRCSAGAWWATYTITLLDNNHIAWTEICAAFYGHHIATSLMHHKQQEFVNLQQGPNIVYEYNKKFNYLA
jgi:hypothetical protein